MKMLFTRTIAGAFAGTLLTLSLATSGSAAALSPVAPVLATPQAQLFEAKYVRHHVVHRRVVHHYRHYRYRRGPNIGRIFGSLLSFGLGTAFRPSCPYYDDPYYDGYYCGSYYSSPYYYGPTYRRYGYRPVFRGRTFVGRPVFHGGHAFVGRPAFAGRPGGFTRGGGGFARGGGGFARGGGGFARGGGGFAHGGGGFAHGGGGHGGGGHGGGGHR